MNMLYRDAFKTATRSLAHGKLRSALTMLGIVIGIASVIILMSIGRSAQDIILGQVEGIGSNLIFITPGAPRGEGFSPPASARGVVITSLTQRDVDALSREPSLKGVAPMVSGETEVVYGNKNETAGYQGVNADFFSAINIMTVGNGSPISASDVETGSRVAVLGPEIAKTLFGASDPVNKTVRLKNVSFRVIGVLDAGGAGPFGSEQGSIVLVPVTVAQKQLLGISHFNAIIVEADPRYEVDFAKSRITSVLRQNHGIIVSDKDDFDIQTQEDVLAVVGNVTSILTIFLAAIASISLVVGGIGIMNIMLVAVIERTREIGLRKAVGATDSDILRQFLMESILLTVLGGVIGIAFGAAVVGIVYVVLTVFFPSVGWVFAFPPSAVALSLAVSTLAGLAFGIYPARQAGRKDPIEALRYE